jgi:hypothetical protein
VLSIPIAVVETPSFLREAASVFTDEERNEMIGFLAANPDAADIMPDIGGGRKPTLESARARQTRWCASDLLLLQ